MSEYGTLVPQKAIEILDIVTVHYFEYTSDFFFPGESHDFWEFLYVDKGRVEVTAGDRNCILKKGMVIFHKPHEFHRLWADGIVAPNLAVVSFHCGSPAMKFFEGRTLPLDDRQRGLLGMILEEAGAAFSSDLSDPNLKKLIRSGRAPFGAEQVITANLELLLISLIRSGGDGSAHLTSTIRGQARQDTFTAVTAYLNQNIGRKVTLGDVCRNNLCGSSMLQKIFREKTGGGVMEYFGKMKISRAKQEIREGKRNFTQIAGDLGYSSIHYFSRHFKKMTGMTPSEYSSSVKLVAESEKERSILLEHGAPPIPADESRLCKK